MPVHVFSSGKIRLGRRGEHYGGVIPTAELVHPTEGGRGQAGWQALSLVKQDDAVCDVVELAADCWPVRKQGFEKADGGGDDDRRAPPGCQLPGVLRQMTLAVVCEDVWDDVGIGVGALLGQRQEGQHDDDPPFPVLQAVPKGKVQQGQRFPGPGGGRQRKQPLRRVAHLAAPVKDLVPIGVQGLI